jgi:hypothetical protein
MRASRRRFAASATKDRQNESMPWIWRAPFLPAPWQICFFARSHGVLSGDSSQSRGHSLYIRSFLGLGSVDIPFLDVCRGTPFFAPRRKRRFTRLSAERSDR